ncbi:MAG TPA: hypothetical protein VEU76_00105, partial [Candidatus Udaeobacter sp.]|nr:hypothetical protein [Candidatus Udaeobacter sp.]
MEARRTFGSSSVSKSFVAVVLVLVAVGLGIMGAYAARNLTGFAAPAAHAQAVQIVPATSLRQDNDYPARAANPQRTLPIRHS